MQSNLTHQQLEDLIPIIAIVFGIAGLCLPAIGFSAVRKVMAEHENMAGLMLASVTAVCITGLLVGAAIILALMGWLPSPAEWLNTPTLK